MPKGKWSAKDERKYEAILKSCKLHAGRKKGAAKTCKRIAAATVNRDRALAGLAGIDDDDEKRWPGITQRKAESALRDRTVRRLWDDYEQKKAAWERAAQRWDAEGTDDARAAKRMAMDELVDAERRLHNWRYHGRLGGLRGAVPAMGALGAQLLSVRLGDTWRSGERELKSGALLREQGGRMALLSDADDPLAPPGRGDVLLSIREGDDEIFSDYFPSIEEANAVLRSKGFRGTPAEHRQQARLLLNEAGAMPPTSTLAKEYAARADEEAFWSHDPETDRRTGAFYKLTHAMRGRR